jgi:hypothetical protein
MPVGSNRDGRIGPLRGPQQRCYTFWPYLGWTPGRSAFARLEAKVQSGQEPSSFEGSALVDEMKRTRWTIVDGANVLCFG